MTKHSFTQIFSLIMAFCCTQFTLAQSVAINTTGAAAAPSSLLDVNSTTKGILVPRMTTAQRNAISAPATGLLIYQTDGTAGFYFYNGSWTALSGSSSISGTANYVTKFATATTLGNSTIFDNGATVGVNTITPSSMAKLHISGVGTLGAAPVLQAGIMVDGTTSSSASGIYAQGGWRGVYGRNIGTSGATEAIGVLGRSEGSGYTTGIAVKGESAGTGPANYGVYGITSATTGTNIGVYGSGNSSGVYGKGGSNGIYGTATGPGFVYTSAVALTTAAIVGQVRTVSTGRPAGILAISTNTGSQSGLLALADSSNVSNYGVEAYAIYAAPTATNYAVYGYTDGSGGTNYAGYFQGQIYASSAASSIKSFKIDHPADPANKYLYHASVESNDMIDMYNGNITTDTNGDAIVLLPDYFTVLNRDYKYQLTCIGQFAQAIISQKVNNNQFGIKTDKPNVEVSWQVTGIRQDPAANAYRVKDVVDKPLTEIGTYLMPELYGYGPEMSPGFKNSAMGKAVESRSSNGVQPKKSVLPVAASLK